LEKQPKGQQTRNEGKNVLKERNKEGMNEREGLEPTKEI
jgi:hypothetical protein